MCVRTLGRTMDSRMQIKRETMRTHTNRSITQRAHGESLSMHRHWKIHECTR